jgi:hypothetical protein
VRAHRTPMFAVIFNALTGALDNDPYLVLSRRMTIAEDIEAALTAERMLVSGEPSSTTHSGSRRARSAARQCATGDGAPAEGGPG